MEIGSKREGEENCKIAGPAPPVSFFVLHYTTRKNDRQLADDLGVFRPRGNEDHSAALSRYIDSGCDPAEK